MVAGCYSPVEEVEIIGHIVNPLYVAALDGDESIDGVGKVNVLVVGIGCLRAVVVPTASI